MLTKVGDRKIASADDLRQLMPTLKPGERVRVEVLRDQQAVAVTIEVGERPVPKKQ